MPQSIRAFIEKLSRTELSTNAFNQYALDGADLTREQREGNKLRRANLRRYLTDMQRRRPSALLIGEAPSHRGARLTGVPFCSEWLILCGIETIEMFGSIRGYEKSKEMEKISTEASATIVWSTIRDLEPIPLLWNAFPFHPYRDGNPFSNRLPSREELRIGQPSVKALTSMFPIEKVLAIGNSASHSLQLLNIPHVKVRHPSQGGKRAFVEGVRRELSA